MKKLCFLFLFISATASAAYYEVLPAGVKNITYQYTMTGEINGRYTSSGNLQGYNVNANINADAIKGINSAVDTYLGTLSSKDYANFSFGNFRGIASTKVDVQGLGGGVGITDKISVYGFVPFYSATVDVNIARTAGGRTNVGGAITLDNLPDVDVRLIQSLFVNYYQYKPLGKWKANDFGDSELGMMVQLKKWDNAGLLMTGGVVAPTGRKDDPDIIQDIAFGDGQWDAFFEFGGGTNFTGAFSDFSVDQWNRLTYQFAYEDEIRLPESSLYPVTSNKGNAKIKYGNKVQSNVQGNYRFSDQWATSVGYSLEYKEKDDYKSARALADAVLEEATDRISHTGRVSVTYSTVNLYQQNSFFLPLSFTVGVQTIFAGRNTPKYERADFQTRLFF